MRAIWLCARRVAKVECESKTATSYVLHVGEDLLGLLGDGAGDSLVGSRVNWDAAREEDQVTALHGLRVRTESLGALFSGDDADGHLWMVEKKSRKKFERRFF